MLASIPCPTCKVNLKTPDKLIGKSILCPKCHNRVKLLVRNGTAPAAPPIAPMPTNDPDATVLTSKAPPEMNPDVPAKAPVKEEEPLDDFTAIEDMVEQPAPSEPAPAASEPEPVDDFAGMEELTETAAEPEEAVESEEVIDEIAEETIEESAVADEEVLEETAVEEAPLVAAEDEDEEAGGLTKTAARFLQRKLFLIKGQTGLFSMNAAWDFLDPDTKKKTGTAVERPKGILQALRFFLRRNWLPSLIEIREEKTNELIFSVRRPSYIYFLGCKLEVRDADNKLLAKFTYKPLSRLVGKPMEIVRKGGDNFAQCQFYLLKGRIDLVDEDEQELANMMTESAYTKALKIYWAPRGGSYYVTFNKPLLDKPIEKMIFLGVTLALDLLQQDTMNNKGGANISVGS